MYLVAVLLVHHRHFLLPPKPINIVMESNVLMRPYRLFRLQYGVGLYINSSYFFPLYLTVIQL